MADWPIHKPDTLTTTLAQILITLHRSFLYIANYMMCDSVLHLENS